MSEQGGARATTKKKMKKASAKAAASSEPKRSGAWTLAERMYAEKVVEGFHEGWLDIDDGTTLRYYLALLLNCDPKRVSKRMEKSDYKGRKGFQKNSSLSQNEINAKRKELEEAKGKFEESLEELRRARMGIFLPGEGPPSSGEEDGGEVEKSSSSSRKRSLTVGAAAAGGIAAAAAAGVPPPSKKAAITSTVSSSAAAALLPPGTAISAASNTPAIVPAAGVGSSVASAFTNFAADLSSNRNQPPSQHQQQQQQQPQPQQQQMSWSNPVRPPAAQGTMDSSHLQLLSSTLCTAPAVASVQSQAANPLNEVLVQQGGQQQQQNHNNLIASLPPKGPAAAPPQVASAAAQADSARATTSSLLDEALKHRVITTQAIQQQQQQNHNNLIASLPPKGPPAPPQVASAVAQTDSARATSLLGEALKQLGQNRVSTTQAILLQQPSPPSATLTTMQQQQFVVPPQAAVAVAPAPPPATTSVNIEGLFNLLNQHQQTTAQHPSASVGPATAAHAPDPQVNGWVAQPPPPPPPQQQQQQQGNLAPFNSFTAQAQAPSSIAPTPHAAASEIFNILMGNNASLGAAPAVAAAPTPTPTPRPTPDHALAILELLGQGQFHQTQQQQQQQQQQSNQYPDILSYFSSTLVNNNQSKKE